MLIHPTIATLSYYHTIIMVPAHKTIVNISNMLGTYLNYLIDIC